MASQARLLECHGREGRRRLERGHEPDPVAVACQLLGQADAREVPVAVEDEYALTGRPLALDHHLFRRQNMGNRRVSARNDVMRGAVQTVTRPARPGRDGPRSARPNRAPLPRPDPSRPRTRPFGCFSSWPVRWVTMWAHSARPGSWEIHRSAPPGSSFASTSETRCIPRLARTSAHSRPAGPAPTTSTSLAAFPAGSNCSGCQPRTNSSPAVAFCVQIRNVPWIVRAAQTLLPTQRRTSPSRPSSILRREERVCDRSSSRADDVEMASAGSPRPSCSDP